MIVYVVMALAALMVYRFWPDICRNIVNTGLDRPQEQATPVDRFHQLTNEPPLETKLKGAIGNLRSPNGGAP